MSLNDPSLDGQIDTPLDGTDGPSIGERTGTAPNSTVDADGRRSRAAIRTENRLLRARAAALERKLRDDREERRRVTERYEALLSERRGGGRAAERAPVESAEPHSGSATRGSKILTAVRNWLARR
ncbi:hypothetical protein [Natronoarchaeum mannanilyticum]